MCVVGLRVSVGLLMLFCVNTSQSIECWGRRFKFLQNHNTPSVLRSYYYAVCLLIILEEVKKILKRALCSWKVKSIIVVQMIW